MKHLTSAVYFVGVHVQFSILFQNQNLSHCELPETGTRHCSRRGHRGMVFNGNIVRRHGVHSGAVVLSWIKRIKILVGKLKVLGTGLYVMQSQDRPPHLSL